MSTPASSRRQGATEKTSSDASVGEPDATATGPDLLPTQTPSPQPPEGPVEQEAPELTDAQKARQAEIEELDAREVTVEELLGDSIGHLGVDTAAVAAAFYGTDPSTTVTVGDARKRLRESQKRPIEQD